MFKQDLKQEIFHITKEEEIDDKIKEKQIYLIRRGIFDTIFYILNSIENNGYVKISIGQEKLYRLKEEIYDLYTLLTYENPFLIILFFTKDFVYSICKNISKPLLNFYIHKLQVIKKYNYKVNLQRFFIIFSEKAEETVSLLYLKL